MVCLGCMYEEAPAPGDVVIEACATPPGMGAPDSVADVVELMNLLQDPVTVPCVLHILDRPLQMVATRGMLSPQPALDSANPRIFIFSGNLVLSVVSAGMGRDLLKMAQYFGTHESLKAELRMPAEQPISHDEPYGRLRYNDSVTVCGFCHRDERPAPGISHPNAMISLAFRPLNAEVILLADVRAQHDDCDSAEDPARCAIYSAIFDHGPVEHRDFAPEMETIFNP
jgi:hypothetical protein